MKAYMSRGGEMRNSAAWGMFLLLASVFAFMVFASPARAAEFNPQNTQELIEAINTANDNAEADSINLVTNGTYTLTEAADNDDELGTSGLPAITSEISINGNGATIERSSAEDTPDFRIFFVDGRVPEDGANLTLTNLTVRGGEARPGDIGGNSGNGGGVLNFGGVLTVGEDSTITENFAEDNGGGIASESVTGTDPDTGNAIVVSSGETTITGSSVSDNEAENDGGGIHLENTVTIENSSINGNTADSDGGSIDSDNTNVSDSELTVENSTIFGNAATNGDGGGIDIDGIVTVTGSTVSGNSSGSQGGGIWANGLMTVDRSTISGNVSESSGGGIYSTTNDYSAGDEPPENGRTTITNSTISGNSSGRAGSGVQNNNGYTEMNFTTVTDNTTNDPDDPAFGVQSFEDEFSGTRLTGTIVAGNDQEGAQAGARDVGNNQDNPRAYESGGYNVLGQVQENRAGDFDETGDETDVTVEEAFGTPTPTLRNNGGPTRTFGLQSGSVAIDRALDGPVTDQRGAPRPADDPDAQNGGATDLYDSGSFERVAIQAGAGLIVTREDDRNIVCLPDDCSLREAITAANATPEANTIEFADSVQTVTLGGTALPEVEDSDVSGTLAIDGAGDVTVDGDDRSRIFEVAENADLTLQRLTVTGGNGGEEDGGAIYVSGSVDLTRSTFTDNTTGLTDDNDFKRGGVAFVDSTGTLVASDSTFSDNSAVRGGAIYGNSHQGMSITASTFSNNTATVSGGAVSSRSDDYLEDEDPPANRLNIFNSTFTNNTAGESGGAIRNSNGFTEISYTTITGNTSPIGAGVSSFNDFVTTTRITASIVTGNDDEAGDPHDVDSFGGGSQRPYETGGYNLIGGGSSAGDFTGTGDVTNVTVEEAFGTANPTLANNGGPTRTIAIESDGLAFDNIPSTAGVPATDQRGVGRPQLAAVDTGSFELEPEPNAAPTISEVEDQNIRENTSTGPLRFTVEDPNDPASELAVSGTSSNTDLVEQSGIVISGTGENRTVTVTPVRNRIGTTNITLTVEDPEGLQDTETFTVVVSRTAPPPANPNACTITGKPGNDILRGTQGRDVICGLGGNDIIRGLGGDDVLRGGAGNDKIYGGDGNDRIEGSSGNDALYGERGNDTILGGADNDVLRGGPGQDSLNGGAGRNQLQQ